MSVPDWGTYLAAKYEAERLYGPERRPERNPSKGSQLKAFLCGALLTVAAFVIRDSVKTALKEPAVKWHLDDVAIVEVDFHGRTYAAALPILGRMPGYSVPVFIWDTQQSGGPSADAVDQYSYEYSPDMIFIPRYPYGR